MAKDAELKLVLNTEEAIQQARKFAPELEKALDVKQAVPSAKRYQEQLTKAAKAKELIDKSGNKNLTKAFDASNLESYNNELKSIFETANKLDAVNKKLEEKRAKTKLGEGASDKSLLSSFAGKISRADDKDAAKAEYKEVNDLLAQRNELTKQFNSQYAEQQARIKEIRGEVVEVNNFEKAHGNQVDKVNSGYETMVQAAEKASDAETSTATSAKADAKATQDAVKATENLASAKAKAAEVETTVTSEEKKDTPDAKPLGTEKAVEDTTQSIEELADKVNGVLNFDMTNAGIADLVRHLQQLNEVNKDIQKMGMPPELDEQFQQIRQDSILTKNAISEWDREFKRTATEAPEAMEQTASAAGRVKIIFAQIGSAIKSGLSSALSVARSVASGIGVAFKSIVSAINSASKLIRSALKNISKVFKSIKSAAQSLAKGIRSAFNGLGNAIKGVRSHFNRMAGENRGNFKHMITNITKYVLGFRSLFFLVRRLRKYIGEGIQNMALFKGGNNDVNKNITSLITSLTYLKNAWATAFSPILSFITPWLTALIDKLAAVGNAFSRFLGSLFGISKVFQAVKTPAKSYAKTLDKAGGSAGKAAKKQKQLNDRLADFDDLHVLGKDNDPTKDGSGGGGGSGDDDKMDPNKMFKLTNVADTIKKQLKDMWSKANFTEVGEKLRDKLLEALNKIDWGKIQNTAYKIGKSIATFLNGALADTALWEKIGSTLAQGVNTLVRALWGFLSNDKVDWGGNLAKLIVRFFNEVDWGTIKNSISVLGKKLVANINSFFANIKSSGIKDKIAGLTESITGLIVTLVTGINWKDVIDAFASFGGAIVEGLSQGLTQSDNSVLQLIGTFIGSIKKAISEGDAGSLATAFLNFISGIFSALDISKILSNIGTFISGLVGGIADAMGKSDNPFIQSLSKWLGSISTAFETGDASQFAVGFLQFITDSLSNINWDTVIATVASIGEQLINGLISGLSSSDDPFLQTLGSLIGTVKDAITALLPVITQIITAVSPIISSILPVIQAIMPGIATLISDIATLVLPLITSVLQVIMPIIQQLVEAILPVLHNILVALQPAFDVLIQTVLPIIADLLNAIMPVITSILGLVEAILVPIANLIAPLLQLISAILGPLVDLLKPLFTTLSMVIDEVSAFLKPIVELLSPLTELLTDCLSPLFDILSIIGEVIGVLVVPIMKILSSAIQSVVIPIIKALTTSLSAVGTVFKVIADGAKFMFGIMKDGFKALWDFLKPLLNTMIGGIEKFANGLINGINAGIKALNKLSFDVPDWVPGIGGKKFGFNLKEVSKVSIPKLAQGAVIPPNNEFMAVLGDQSHGTNIEAPLDTIKQAVAEVMSNNGNAEVIQLLQQLIAVVESKNLVIGDKEIGKANARYANKQRIIRGTSF